MSAHVSTPSPGQAATPLPLTALRPEWALLEPARHTALKCDVPERLPALGEA
ncbi:hypothetical protein HUS70_12095 [Pandoraea nosoerga]|uniref:hypothetical protein n=1 Tax=Pandoraea nosoerga TaxID=2508296 RepID=UPI001583CEF0|nr:hypothetical protein [Pandoraea nosoerga]MBN4666201.1 hypothetical protein [Pandoraea nosoerga]MBN4681293.1 hypothetical protein [Pandoraea nosoerga]MBN4745368.1 hypothetical protein [Pandoraea nosoerga]